MKKAQDITQKSANDLSLMHTSAIVESQKLDKTSVVHHIDQYCDKLALDCSPENFGSTLRSVSDKGELDKSVAEFTKQRAQYYKTLILKNKLNGIHDMRNF